MRSATASRWQNASLSRPDPCRKQKWAKDRFVMAGDSEEEPDDGDGGGGAASAASGGAASAASGDGASGGAASAASGAACAAAAEPKGKKSKSQLKILEVKGPWNLGWLPELQVPRAIFLSSPPGR